MEKNVLRYLEFWLNFYGVNAEDSHKILEKVREAFADFYRLTKHKVEEQWKQHRKKL
jgi:hypothetical protein